MNSEQNKQSHSHKQAQYKHTAEEHTDSSELTIHQRYTSTEIFWDGPTENVNYLGYAANISKEKKTL